MNAGTAYEAELERANAVYRRLRIADIDRLPVDTVPAPRRFASAQGGGGLRVLCEQQRADFYGWLGRDALGLDAPPTLAGRAVLVEAKADHADKPATSLPIATRSRRSSGRSAYGSGLKLHQLEALVAAADFGALVGVAWRSGPTLRPRRVVILEPALRDALEEHRRGGRRSIPADMGTPYELARVGRLDTIEHYLAPIIDHAQEAHAA